ncbi:serine protease AprX [Motilibacter rhizosphaerae]|uniref:Serine protease AprX n=1 Tax=Motilibacter rhizosphaerae TaxID=598652 RepID=A0A4Q7NVR7_9ACTN|nr:S8 family serine peptidase [Motilibacter rhizosphaerae]RZS91351.1 serine protease AprX [Motilibacter rhizosphaerae]
MTRSTTARGALAMVGLVGGLLAVGAPAHAQQPEADPRSSQSTWLAVADGDLGAASAAATRAGAQVTKTLPGIGQLVLRADAAEVAALRASGTVRSVTLDAHVHLSAATFDPSTDPGSSYNVTQAIGARDMWKAGYTGSGIDIALIDSGVAPGTSAGWRMVSGPDLSFDSQDPNARRGDKFGHGTHLASIMVGDDNTADKMTNTGAQLGVAPDARVISVKVGDVNGGVDVSQVIAAIDWCVQNKANQVNLRVINLSFGTDSKQAWNLDPVAYAAEAADRKGIVVVAAAGNTGGVGLDDPAYDPNVLAVGASDPRGTVSTSDDAVASFSTRGNGTRNPDLVAPGVGIVGLRAPGSVIDSEVPGGGSRWLRGTGTSQAAAVVSGAVALLLQQRSALTPEQVKAILRGSATPLTGFSAADQGAGELNLTKAMAYATPAASQAQAGTGTGTIDAARGSQVLILDTKPLTGEVDVYGNPVNTAQLASLANSGAAWNQGSFNGQLWAQNYWDNANVVTGAEQTWGSVDLTARPLWSGLTLSGWTSRSWSSRSWSSRSWSSRSWSGRYWSDMAWQVPDGTAPAAATSTTTAACSTLPAWSAGATYNGGSSVTYGGRKWTARYWTQGNTPGDATGVWGTSASC